MALSDGTAKRIDVALGSPAAGSEVTAAINALATIGVTPGTVAASSAVIVDSNKDVSGFRNVGMTAVLTVGTTTGTSYVAVTDNLAAAWGIKEGSNPYITIVTTNSAETVLITPLLTCVAGISFTGATGLNVLKVVDNLASALVVKEGSTAYVTVVTTNSAETVAFGVNVTLSDVNVILGTATGTKIGTATGQKLGFWNATPVIQQAAAAQAAVTPSTSFTGTDTVDKAVVLAAVQAVEILVNRLRLDLVTTGVIKGAA